MTPAGFPHSDISDSCACTRLVGAFRSVPRPSSALDAKASTVCPYLRYTCDTETSTLLLACLRSRACSVCVLLALRLFSVCCVYVVVKLLHPAKARWLVVEAHPPAADANLLVRPTRQRIIPPDPGTKTARHKLRAVDIQASECVA